ncbi:phage portal protein [Methylorubrum extorquens]
MAGPGAAHPLRPRRLPRRRTRPEEERRPLRRLHQAHPRRRCRRCAWRRATGTDAPDDDGAAGLDLEPGTLEVLADGEDVTFAQPPDSGPNFEPYLRTMLRGVAVAAGVLQS